MQKFPSCSFHSSQSSFNKSQIELKEQSILNEYDRMHSQNQTHQYSTQSLPYSGLPKFLNHEIKARFEQCVYLDKFTFYEMFTMLIMEYLFKDMDQKKEKKILNLKYLICEPEFLEGSIFTKGLLLKGFKTLQQVSISGDFSHPLGQYLLSSDSISAFTQCWKQLVTKVCKQNKFPSVNEDQIDSSIFELFASYFHVNFQVFWKQKGNKLWKENFTFEKADGSTDKLSIIVNPDNQISVSQRCIRVSDSRVSGNSMSTNKHGSSWNYIILTNPPQKKILSESIQQQAQGLYVNQKADQKDELPNGQEISRISQIEYSCGETEQIKILLEDKIQENQTGKKKNGKNPRLSVSQSLTSIVSTMNKANKLIEEMKIYSQYLEASSMQLEKFSIIT